MIGTLSRWVLNLDGGAGVSRLYGKFVDGGLEPLRPKSILRAKRRLSRNLQVIWWGFAMDRMALRFVRDDGEFGRIYRWRLLLGPVEIRRWAK